MIKTLTLIKIVPPSRGEVEHSFSLTKLICTPLRNWLLQDNLEQCMKITLFEKDLLKNDNNDVLKGG